MVETPPQAKDQAGEGQRRVGRRLFINLALMATSLAVTLGVGELGVRISGRGEVSGGAGPSLYTHDSRLGWSKRPGISVPVSTPEFQITETINDLGLRGPETTIEKPEGTKRVLLLGDSFLEGYTVDDTSLVSAQLQQILNRDGASYEVLNGGTAGYSTDQQLLFFEAEGASFQPDITVLLFYVNDVWFNARPDYWRGSKPYFELSDSELEVRGVPVPAPAADRFAYAVDGGRGAARVVRSTDAWLGSRSALYRLFRGTITGSPTLSGLAIRLGAADVPGEFMAWQRSPDPETARAWEITEAILIRLRDRVEASGSRFIVFYVPSRPAVYDDDWDSARRKYAMSDDAWHPAADGDRLLQICEQRGVDCTVDVDRFRSEARRLLAMGERLYFRGDGHWTAAGHYLAATSIAEAIDRPPLHER